MDWSRDMAMLHAAGIAFYTIFSLAPLLILSISIADNVYVREDVEWRIVAGVEKRAGEPAATYVNDIIVNAKNSAGGRLATGISIIFLIWGGSTMFLQLQSSINEMWEIVPRSGAMRHNLTAILKSRLLTAVVVLGIGYFLLASLTLSTLWAMIPARYLNSTLAYFDEIAPFVRTFTSPVINAVIFAIIFKILPQAKIRWRDVWLGAALTSLLFWFGNYLISFYLANGVVKSLYGAAGSVMVFLLWVYYTAWIFLFGAKFTYIYAREYGVPIKPYDYMMAKPYYQTFE